MKAWPRATAEAMCFAIVGYFLLIVVLAAMSLSVMDDRLMLFQIVMLGFFALLAGVGVLAGWRSVTLGSGARAAALAGATTVAGTILFMLALAAGVTGSLSVRPGSPQMGRAVVGWVVLTMLGACMGWIGSLLARRGRRASAS